MKLLSPSETKDKREKFNAALDSRSATLDETIVSKRKELLTLEESFVRTLENQRLVRLKEDVEWEERNRTLRTETEELERRKATALIPLEERWKEIENMGKALLQREESVSKREQESSDNLELLELRLDEASDRLASIQTQEERIKRRMAGLVSQEKETKERVAQFNDVLSKNLLVLEEQRLAIATLTAEQKGRDIVLSERENRLFTKEKDLVSREKALADRYTTLGRAIKEAQKKYSIPDTI